MAAPKGNKNAEKWTLEKAEELIKNALDLSNEEEDFKLRDNKGNIIDTIKYFKYDFIGEVARKLGTYHENITRDIPNRHPSLKPLIDIVVKNLEANCYSNTKKNMINTAVGIINLKSNHGWTDRVDQTTKGEKTTNEKVTISFTDKTKK